MRRITVILLVLTTVFAAISVYGFAEMIHPRRAVLWVALAVVSLFAAGLSTRADRHGVSPRSRVGSST
jgi:presenilin-like A22 family membrane protease